jgi:hypothetical protein
MSLTVLEQIARELLSRLEAMIGNTDDYQIDVEEVIRPTRLGSEITVKDRQIILRQGQNVEVPELMYPGNPPAVCRRQTFNIRCNLLTDEDDDEAIDNTINTFAADVIVAVTSETNWHNFGDLAINAYFLDREYSDGGLATVTMPLAIEYRVDENNPYTVRG